MSSSPTHTEEEITIDVTGIYVFQLGETFQRFDQVEERLRKHSEVDFVNYWRRDTRTVKGALMKTTRPIADRLKYYSIRYACVHGGQKYSRRGQGQRSKQTMRTGCPSYIMLRADKYGQQLEVIGVCNRHNHPISRTESQQLPQNRRLPPDLRADVLKMMNYPIDRKKIIEYIRVKCGKVVTSKDLLNLKATGSRTGNDKKELGHALSRQELLNKITMVIDEQQQYKDNSELVSIGSVDRTSAEIQPSPDVSSDLLSDLYYETSDMSNEFVRVTEINGIDDQHELEDDHIGYQGHIVHDDPTDNDDEHAQKDVADNSTNIQSELAKVQEYDDIDFQPDSTDDPLENMDNEHDQMDDQFDQIDNELEQTNDENSQPGNQIEYTRYLPDQRDDDGSIEETFIDYTDYKEDIQDDSNAFADNIISTKDEDNDDDEEYYITQPKEEDQSDVEQNAMQHSTDHTTDARLPQTTSDDHQHPPARKQPSVDFTRRKWRPLSRDANKKKIKNCKHCGLNAKLVRMQIAVLKAQKQKLHEETEILRLNKERLLDERRRSGRAIEQ